MYDILYLKKNYEFVRLRIQNQYICDNYESLAEYTIFLQGNPFDHSPNLISNLTKYINNKELSMYDLLYLHYSKKPHCNYYLICFPCYKLLHLGIVLSILRFHYILLQQCKKTLIIYYIYLNAHFKREKYFMDLILSCDTFVADPSMKRHLDRQSYIFCDLFFDFVRRFPPLLVCGLTLLVRGLNLTVLCCFDGVQL